MFSKSCGIIDFEVDGLNKSCIHILAGLRNAVDGGLSTYGLSLLGEVKKNQEVGMPHCQRAPTLCVV